MKVLFYSTKKFEKEYLLRANLKDQVVHYTEEPLSMRSASLAKSYQAISIFTGDDASAAVIRKLSTLGVQFIATRAAGYDNVDIEEAARCNLQVANVPEYSPYAIAEHAVAMILALNRKLILANKQVNQLNFSLDNLISMDLHGKTVGIIGTGRIGCVFARIMHGFGCNLLAYDIHPNQLLVKNQLVYYTDLLTLCRESHIISLHTPLNDQTRYMISAPLIREMKRGVMLINTARGALVRTEDVLTYLDNGQIGCYGMDVYEKEKGIFFFDHTGDQIHDPCLHSLLNNSNVLVTPHQAFATREALQNIAKTTFDNLDAWANGQFSGNELIELAEPLSRA